MNDNIKIFLIYLITFIFIMILILTKSKIIDYQQDKIAWQNYEYQVLDKQKEEVIKQGYENVYYDLNKIVKDLEKFNLKYNYRVDLHGSMEKAIINKYDYYAKYYITKVDNKNYIFKNKNQCEEFIDNIKKYTKEDYNIENLTLFINKETKEEELNNIINDKKIAYEKAQAEAAARRRRASSTKSKGEYQNYAYNLVINTYGWSEYDFECLVWLWDRESKWNPNAHNKSSGAHGIPQALPASKMASEGADYYTNGYTQIRWGLKYIKRRYGSPSNAWAHFQNKHWY